MKPIAYHVGLTSPPLEDMDEITISYHPVLQVDHSSFHLPDEIDEMLNQELVFLLMSKNSVFGLEKWLAKHGLDSDYFRSQVFWTVGDRTQACLMDALCMKAFHPKLMTGRGVLEALNEQKKSKIILISGNKPQQDFIQGLNSFGINFFHFPVYEIKIKEDLEFLNKFQNHESHFLVITSPSAVDGVLKNLEFDDLSNIKTRIVSIGPTTTKAIRQKNGHVFHESRLQNIQALYDDLQQLVFDVHHD